MNEMLIEIDNHQVTYHITKRKIVKPVLNYYILDDDAIMKKNNAQVVQFFIIY